MDASVSSTRKTILLWAACLASGLASGLAAASGLSDNTRLGEVMTLYVPGALFALLVLLPGLAGLRFQLLRGLLLILTSMSTYYAAVRLSAAMHGRDTFLLLIAGVGAVAAGVMVFVPSWITRARIGVFPAAVAIAMGGLGGLTIGWPLSTESPLSGAMENAVMVLGFVVWQCGVGFALGRNRAGSAASMAQGR